MNKCGRVAVYDNSLYMAGIAASLKVDTTLEVCSVDLNSAKSIQKMDENEFSAIIFDLSDPPACLNIALLRDRPGLLLIGVDPTLAEMLVFSSRSAHAISVSDLVNIIHQENSLSSPA